MHRHPHHKVKTHRVGTRLVVQNSTHSVQYSVLYEVYYIIRLYYNMFCKYCIIQSVLIYIQ